MTDNNHFEEEYAKQLTRLMKKKLSETDTEFIETVFETKWIRLLLLKSIQDDVECISIEVELSLPKCNSSQQTDTSLVQGMITHLEYFETLQNVGFNIEVMASDCLWTATKIIDTTPSKELYKVLHPPR